jgi:carbonic anhydrase
MNRKVLISSFSVLVVSFVVLSACTPASTPPPTPTSVHWTYEGEEGPEHWGGLDTSYAACGVGKSQSPVDVVNPASQDLENIAFHYQPSEVRILNNGHTVQVNYDSGSYIEIDGQRYDVMQFHYHAPSEHTLNGKLFAAELHIVHKSATGQLAVVGILLEEGAENTAYQPLLANLPAEKSPEIDAGVKINAMDLLPAVQTTFRYSGSLTTPPCTEGVSWIVMVTPVQLSVEQIADFEKIYEGNNRPVQPLNTRPLIEDSTP